MKTGCIFQLCTQAGPLHLMLVDNTIVGYRDGDKVHLHHVPELKLRPAVGGENEPDIPSRFSSLHSSGDDSCPDDLVVAHIAASSNTQVAFFRRDWRWPELYGWGYVWDVDHPDRSRWERADCLADTIIVEDLAHTLRPYRLLNDLLRLAEDAKHVHPRAAALAAVADPFGGDLLQADIAGLMRWIDDLQAALDECACDEYGEDYYDVYNKEYDDESTEPQL